jgi:cytoskeleton protein RodZ
MPQVPPSQAAAAMPPPVAAPAPSAAPPSDVTTDAAAAPDAGKIVLKATADAWVQVREKSGPVLLNRVLRAGDTWDVPADKPQLLLTTGNAGGTQLLIDGVATAPLGSPGAVRRDLPLDPDMIRAGKLSPAGNSTSKPAGQ